MTKCRKRRSQDLNTLLDALKGPASRLQKKGSKKQNHKPVSAPNWPHRKH